MSAKDVAESFSIHVIDHLPLNDKKLIAIDPGGNTGIAIRNKNDYFVHTFTKPDMVFDLLVNDAWDAVIYEDFNTGGNISKDGQHTLKLIGGILALCWDQGFTTHRQMPQERYPFLSRANIVLRERYKSSTTHEKDALAHLLCWEYKHATSQIQGDAV